MPVCSLILLVSALHGHGLCRDRARQPASKGHALALAWMAASSLLSLARSLPCGISRPNPPPRLPPIL